MNIALIPAQEVPTHFSNWIRRRRNSEKAFVTSMSAEFQENPILQDLLRYGLPDDAVVFDYFGHRHGVIPTKTIRRAHEEARSRFQRNFPGSYTVVGPPPRINLTNSTILNRSHIKAYAVGDRVMSLGGVNCAPCSYYDFIDVMLGFESGRFVASLRTLLERGVQIRQQGVGESLWLDEQNEVVIDYGRRSNRSGLGSKSVILSSLINDLEKEITSATLSSTAIPYGKLDSVLSRHAQKGRNITFYTNRPSKFTLPHHSSYERLLQKTCAMRAKTSWVDNRPDKFNHLKAAIITYRSGDKVAYIGSHNFHELHVWAGTADICLRTTDNKLIDQLEDFIDKNLATPANIQNNSTQNSYIMA